MFRLGQDAQRKVSEREIATRDGHASVSYRVGSADGQRHGWPEKKRPIGRRLSQGSRAGYRWSLPPGRIRAAAAASSRR